jgi:hypothetical protein
MIEGALDKVENGTGTQKYKSKNESDHHPPRIPSILKPTQTQAEAVVFSPDRRLRLGLNLGEVGEVGGEAATSGGLACRGGRSPQSFGADSPHFG